MAKTSDDSAHKWAWQRALEYLGGERDTSPSPRLPNPSSWAWGLWWGILLFLVIFFCGQATRFIYIDF